MLERQQELLASTVTELWPVVEVWLTQIKAVKRVNINYIELQSDFIQTPSRSTHTISYRLDMFKQQLNTCQLLHLY